MKVKLFLAYLFSFFFVSPPVFAVTLGEIINPIEEFLECNDLEWYEKAVCNYLSSEVNKVLNENSLSLNNGSIIFTLENPYQFQRLDGGCGYGGEVRTYLKSGGVFSATLESQTSLVFEGDSISSPLITLLKAPVSLYTAAHLQENWAQKVPVYKDTIFGPVPDGTECEEVHLDDYWADASSRIEVKIALHFSFEPKYLGKDENGDYLIQISPTLNIIPDFEVPELSFDIHDKNITTIPFNVVDVMNNFGQLNVDLFLGSNELLLGSQVDDTSSFSQFLENIGMKFVEDSGVDLIVLVEEFSDVETLDIDIPIPIILSTEMFGVPGGPVVYVKNIEFSTQEAIASFVARYNEELDSYAAQERDRLQEKIKDILSLDENGKKIFVIPREVVDGRLMSAIVPIMNILQ